MVTFDILDPSYTTELVFEFDENKQELLNEEILDQMEDLGYDTHNSMLNLGSLAIFSFVYFVKLGVYVFVVLPVKYFTGRGSKMMKSMQETLFYGEFIFLVIEAYLEFLIAGYLNLKEPITTKNGEVLSIAIGWYCALTTLIVMPAAFVYMFTRSTEVLSSESFKQKWEALYERVDPRDKFNLLYYPIFCGRRVIFCYLCFSLFHLPSIQFISLMLLNTLILEYIAGQKPLHSRFLNRLEIFNELTSLLSTFHMAFFTDWIIDPVLQHTLGWSIISFISLNIVVN